MLAKVTGMTRSLQDIHRTVDDILEEIIAERKAIRDEKIKSFHLSNSRIKAIILVIV